MAGIVERSFGWSKIAFLATGISLVSLNAFAGDPQSARSVETLTPSAAAETRSLPPSSCKTEIGEYESKDRIDLDWGFGYEEAMLGKWEGHYWLSGREEGAVFNIHMTEVDRENGKKIIKSYYTMKEGSVDGCGEGSLTRWPSANEGQKYNHTRLGGSGIFYHTHWEHPHKLYRVRRTDGRVDYYMTAETKFGQKVKGGPWATTVTLKAVDEETVERLEEIYFIRHPWLVEDDVSEK